MQRVMDIQEKYRKYCSYLAIQYEMVGSTLLFRKFQELCKLFFHAWEVR